MIRRAVAARVQLCLTCNVSASCAAYVAVSIDCYTPPTSGARNLCCCSCACSIARYPQCDPKLVPASSRRQSHSKSPSMASTENLLRSCKWVHRSYSDHIVIARRATYHHGVAPGGFAADIVGSRGVAIRPPALPLFPHRNN